MGGIYWGDPDSFQNNGLNASDFENFGTDLFKAFESLGYEDYKIIEKKTAVAYAEDLEEITNNCPKCPRKSQYELEGFWAMGYTRVTTTDSEGNYRHYYKDGTI